MFSYCIADVLLVYLPQYTSSGTSGDFTMAATLYPNGTWVDPAPGPS